MLKCGQEEQEERELFARHEMPGGPQICFPLPPSASLEAWEEAEDLGLLQMRHGGVSEGLCQQYVHTFQHPQWEEAP